MKKIITLSLSLLFITSFYAQKLDYDHDSKWFFGLNAGGTWQTTDVKDKLYVGYGFVLGRSFNYNYGKKFSFDLRFRYLGGKWYGQDYDTTNVTGNSGYDPTGNVVQKYDTTLGYTINNFQAQVHELGLELVLHANSLRERTGWDPYIFGGVNVVWNQTFGDLYNQDSSVFNNSYYNYSPNGMSKSEWKGLSDDIYDSALDGSSQSNYNVNFMPSLGIGLAYQVGPRFSVGIEHKTTFALKDNFDGYKNSTKRWGMFTNDVYHYTSLMLKFNFRSRKVDNEIEAVNNDCLKPAIGIVTPVEKTLTVSSLDFDLEALISQVAGKNNITLSLNGVRDTNFVYSTETSKLKKSFTLIKGQNAIDIVASNGCGTTTEKITVNYEECVPPVVSFINPSTSQITTSDENYTITAKLEREKTIVYSINGRELRNYNVNEKDSTFSSTITLAEGKNEIKITVSNECGTDEKTIEVTYVRCDKPVVKIKNGDRAIKVDKNTYTVDALFENVTSKSQISLKLNNVVKSFSYNTSSKELIQKVTLNEGLNTIEIKASNNCGDVTETITVEYAPCITPSIAMLSPTSPTLTTDQTGYSVQAKIENISDANQVAVVVNGRTVRTGTYNSTTKVFKKIIPLNDGKNTISLTATTECGTVSSNFTITKTVEDEDIIVCFKSQTLIIKESQWASYQGQGAVLGECPQVIDKDMTICFKGQTLVIKESQWTSYQRQGATQGECPKVVDKDMTICFKGQTLVIKESQWTSYQRQGATQGECPKVVDKDMTICFKGQTLVIKESQWTSYQRQGATQGECPQVVDNDMVICFKGRKLTIKESQWPSYQVQGAVQGECPQVVDNDIVICFKGRKLTIKESQLLSYLKQGATEGECPEPESDINITICLKGETKVIKESEWASYQSKGAVRGECVEQEGEVEQEETMIICHGATASSSGTTMEILVSEWPAHQAHGDTIGECVEASSVGNDEVVICLNGETKIIKKIQLAKFKLQGATEGPCN